MINISQTVTGKISHTFLDLIILSLRSVKREFVREIWSNTFKYHLEILNILVDAICTNYGFAYAFACDYQPLLNDTRSLQPRYETRCESLTTGFQTNTKCNPDEFKIDTKWTPNGLQTESKMESKWIPKHNPNGIQMEPKRNPNGIQKDPKRIPNGPQPYPNTDPMQNPNGIQTDHKCNPNGTQADRKRNRIDTNWSQTDTKRITNGTDTESKLNPNGSYLRFCFYISSWSLKFFGSSYFNESIIC